MAEFLAVPVVSKNGLRGKVLVTSRFLDDRPEKIIVWETGRETPVSSRHLHLRTDGSYYLDLTVDPRAQKTKVEKPSRAAQAVSRHTPTAPVRAAEELPQAAQLPQNARSRPDTQLEDETVIPRIEEQVAIGKRKVETGRVRVQKTVTAEPVLIDEPTIRESYDVERIPINRPVDEPGPVRREHDRVIVPVYEEQITKQLILKEEVHLTRKREEVHNPQTVKLRKEEVKVERTKAE